MAQTYKVGIADMQICRAPDLVTTIGLGSCIGIAIRDTALKRGGLVHIMLPDSTQISGTLNVAKFADTGIEELVRQLEKEGCSRSRMEAKIAGGAQMFAFHSKTDLAGIGTRNAEAARQKLKELGIPLRAEDTGKNYGRTVIFNPENGEYEVRAVGKQVIVI